MQYYLKLLYMLFPIDSAIYIYEIKVLNSKIAWATFQLGATGSEFHKNKEN